MKTTLALFTLLTIFQTLPWVIRATPLAVNPLTVFDDELREIVELFKLQMVCGYGGIPPLAPYKEDQREIVIQSRAIDLQANLKDLVVTGLNQFDVVELYWNNVLQKLTYNFKFATLQAKAQYSMTADARFLGGTPQHVWGDGDMNVLLRNVNLAGSFKLRPTLSTSGGLHMYDFKADVAVETVKSTTTGVMNSKIYSKIFDEFLQEFMLVMFNESQDEISYGLEKLVVPPANNALKNLTIVQLLGLIFGLAGENAIPVNPTC